jgi:hypothetical protein
MTWWPSTTPADRSGTDMTRELIIETNGYFFRVVERIAGISHVMDGAFPTLADAEQYRERYTRKHLGEWKPVDAASDPERD